MDTTYTNFNYNNNVFQYNYNIFKNNLHIGIGTSYPQHELDIKGNFSSSHNLNINGGLFYNNYTDNTTNLLAYNVNTNQIYPLKLINQTNSYNTNKYDWVLNNNNLKLEFHNKNDNTIIPYQSINYSIDNNILIYSKYNITITHIFLYQLQQNNNILPSSGIYKLNVNNTEEEEGSIFSSPAETEDYYTIEQYKKLFQIVAFSGEQIKVEIVNSIHYLSKTNRGEGGFGSTDDFVEVCSTPPSDNNSKSSDPDDEKEPEPTPN